MRRRARVQKSSFALSYMNNIPILLLLLLVPLLPPPPTTQSVCYKRTFVSHCCCCIVNALSNCSSSSCAMIIDVITDANIVRRTWTTTTYNRTLHCWNSQRAFVECCSRTFILNSDGESQHQSSFMEIEDVARDSLTGKPEKNEKNKTLLIHV